MPPEARGELSRPVRPQLILAARANAGRCSAGTSGPAYRAWSLKRFPAPIAADEGALLLSAALGLPLRTADQVPELRECGRAWSGDLLFLFLDQPKSLIIEFLFFNHVAPMQPEFPVRCGRDAGNVLGSKFYDQDAIAGFPLT